MNTKAKNLKRLANIKIAKAFVGVALALGVALFGTAAWLFGAANPVVWFAGAGTVTGVLFVLVFGTIDFVEGIRVKFANRRAIKLAAKDAETVKLGKELIAEKAKLNKKEAKIGKATSKVQKATHKLTEKERLVKERKAAEEAEAKRIAAEAIAAAEKNKIVRK